ncbi:hypothetical protein NP493_12g04028 [Ridgeia piscesae]|uniref:G-protein coupled receptors family 1 profile domain-containing protein n=1 Tax=Ridgeia piscesae TaxID=27915 RepID=A0AAD9PF82_RIDPI|nr:hypothetical protein NP493_12g04028 [Ridgeia piscesae]
MASPALQPFCCFFRDNSSSPESSEQGFHLNEPISAYNALCIFSSTASVCGAIYQLLPRSLERLPRARRELESFLRQNAIICWLTLADLFASLGVLLRSSMWLAGFLPYTHIKSSDHLDFSHFFCAVSSAWIQYFYLCTYFWTFCYAVDVALLVADKKSHSCIYHALSWVGPLLLSVGTLMPLYYPSLLRCELKFSHLVPLYLSTYIPILVVMIVNPILYTIASKRVTETLMSCGQFTDQERLVVSNVRHKFCQVTLVFYACWVGNVLNGFLLLLGSVVSTQIFVAIWVFMGVMNPLQALLNSIVYRGAGGWVWSCHLPRSKRHHNHIQQMLSDDSTEVSNLLSFSS